MAEAEAARQQGNELYKAGKAKEALAAYARALAELKDAKADAALPVHKNMAACFIKLVRAARPDWRRRAEQRGWRGEREWRCVREREAEEGGDGRRLDGGGGLVCVCVCVCVCVYVCAR